MAYIESKKHWEGYDFRGLLEAFLNPYFSWTEPVNTHPPITQKDILTNSPIYTKYVEKHMGYYERKLNTYTELWLYRFQ